jgi:transposase-like protein
MTPTNLWTVPRSTAKKQEIVAESLGPDTTPKEVARKHAISSRLLYAWRQQMLGGNSGPRRDRLLTLPRLRSPRHHRDLRCQIVDLLSGIHAARAVAA